MRDDLPDVEAIRASIRDSNIKGIGAFSRVYNIDTHPNYVAKVRITKEYPVGRAILENPSSIPFEAFQIVEDPNFQGRNFGQPIAQYFEDGDVQILLKQNGIECGVPLYLRTQEPFKLSEADLDKLYLESLMRVSSIPQSGYTQFLQDLEFLASIGYDIDASFSENLLADENPGTFNLVDLTFVGVGNVEITKANWLYDLICGGGYIFDRPELELEGSPFALTVLDKLLTACEELNIPFMKEHPEDHMYLDGLNAPEGSKLRKELVQRIQQTHGANERMPTKKCERQCPGAYFEPY